MNDPGIKVTEIVGYSDAHDAIAGHVEAAIGECLLSVAELRERLGSELNSIPV